MSLFHYQEWFDAIFKDGITIAVGELFDYRDQIVLGTLNGILAIIDPGRDVDNRQETSSLIEQQFPHPIIQVFIGKFVNSYDGQVLAILHPKDLVFYRVVKESEETCRLEIMFQHKIKGQPAYNMCQGNFGKSERPRICVQTINCSMHFFESENHILTRNAHQQIHPGPIVYNDVTESMLTTCGGILSSIKFSAIASLPSTTKSQKHLIDWELNLGDTPVDLKCVSILPVQPSIVVLCRRSLHCLTTGGVIRYTIRLENPAMSMFIQTKGAEISIILATHIRTLIFYHDTTQIWAAQLNFIPITVELGCFGENFRNMIVMLSDDNRLSIGYLGTEPSLFRMPVTDSRYIDFPERQKELQEYEERIAASTKTGDETDIAALKMQIELKLDSQSNAIDSEEGVPSATLQVILTGDFQTADIFVHSSLSVFQIGNEPVIDGTGFNRKSIYMFNMFAEGPILDHRMTVMALVDNRECCHHNCYLPLKLIGEQTAAQKSAIYKFTLESTEIGMDTNLLFPEFESENQSSIGFRLFYTKEIVSIFVSQKANRYRIQSDNQNFCFVMISELLERIKKLQPDAKIQTNGVPMQLFLRTIADYLEVEKRRELEEKMVKRLSIQMRHIEMILLQKLKSEHEPPASHINVLINHTYRELLMGFDRLTALEEKTSPEGQKNLRSQMNLFHLLLKLADVELPFDGSILDGTFQKLGDRISSLLPNSIFAGTATPEPVEIIRMIVTYCERGGKLGGIAEEDEEEEQQEKIEENDFVELKSGTVPIRFND